MLCTLATQRLQDQHACFVPEHVGDAQSNNCVVCLWGASLLTERNFGADFQARPKR